MKAAITTFLNSGIVNRLRELGPYFLVELIVPGGTILAALLWWHRRHRQEGRQLCVFCKNT